MKAELVFWHKARIQDHYVLEMEIYRIAKSSRYKDGLKYGLIFVDTRSGKRVLMDNHHPKGPHIHIDNNEVKYEYVNEEKLVRDFKTLVLEQMGVKI